MEHSKDLQNFLEVVTIRRSAWHLASGIWHLSLASGIWGHMTVARDEAKGSCTLGNLGR